MINPFEGYEKAIHAWQDLDYVKLEQVEVADAMQPLKLFLLGKDQEAQELLEAVENRFIKSYENAFILEARLVSGSYDHAAYSDVSLSKEITSLYDRAYFANITLAEDYVKNQNPEQAIDAYEKAVSVATNSQKVISDMIYACILAEKPANSLQYAGLLQASKEKWLAYAGLATLSSIYGKAALAVILTLLSLLTPWSLPLFAAGILFFALEYRSSRKEDNHLITLVARNYLLFLGIFTALSVLILIIR